MKIVRPALARGFGSCLGALIGTPLLGAVVLGLAEFITWINRINDPRHALSPEAERYMVFAITSGFALLTILMAIHGLLFPLGTRYIVGATDLTLDRGILWRRTTTIPLISITRIETGSGPLARLFGLHDLHVYTTSSLYKSAQGVREWASVVLLGVNEGDDLRRQLLDRRDTIQESVLRGDLSIARTPQELQLDRLAGAVERLERRLSLPARKAGAG